MHGEPQDTHLGLSQRHHRYWDHIVWGSQRKNARFWGACRGVPLTRYGDHDWVHVTRGWIYAAIEERTPLVKIGCTQSGTETRLRGLVQQFKADLVLVGAVYIPALLWSAERAVHNLLAPQHVQGEWFYLPMNQALLEQAVWRAWPPFHSLNQALSCAPGAPGGA